MLIRFDHGTPAGLARASSPHTVVTAQARGGDRLTNGALLTAAEAASFDVSATTDRRIRHQQNLSRRKMAIVVLAGSTKWSRIRIHFGPIATAVNASAPGTCTKVAIQFD